MEGKTKQKLVNNNKMMACIPRAHANMLSIRNQDEDVKISSSTPPTWAFGAANNGTNPIIIK